MKKYILIALSLFIIACSGAVRGNKSIILATTTSTQDSGLLDVLIPIFEEQTGYTVQTIAIGDGLQAIYETESLFVSCGDDSGTHKKELDLWGKTELDPVGKNRYIVSKTSEVLLNSRPMIYFFFRSNFVLYFVTIPYQHGSFE